MTVPVPNCGHQSTTYKHDVFRDLWMCFRCVCSLIGFTAPRCEGCGVLQSPSTKQRMCRSCVDQLRDARRAR